MNRSAIFKCSAKGITAEVAVPLKDGATEETVHAEMKLGQAFAARRFKRSQEMHPCVTVKTEYVGIKETA